MLMCARALRAVMLHTTPPTQHLRLPPPRPCSSPADMWANSRPSTTKSSTAAPPTSTQPLNSSTPGALPNGPPPPLCLLIRCAGPALHPGARRPPAAHQPLGGGLLGHLRHRLPRGGHAHHVPGPGAAPGLQRLPAVHRPAAEVGSRCCWACEGAAGLTFMCQDFRQHLGVNDSQQLIGRSRTNIRPCDS